MTLGGSFRRTDCQRGNSHAATHAEQRVVEAPLRDIARVALEAQIEAPALFVVGEVVGLRARLGLAARGALDTNRSTIDVMHGIGATDDQIARLFQRRLALGQLGFAAYLIPLALIGEGARLFARLPARPLKVRVIGILLFIWNFIRHGLPSDEAIGANIEGTPAPAQT